MAKLTLPSDDAAGLSVRERVLLLCVASRLAARGRPQRDGDGLDRQGHDLAPRRRDAHADRSRARRAAGAAAAPMKCKPEAGRASFRPWAFVRFAFSASAASANFIHPPATSKSRVRSWMSA